MTTTLATRKGSILNHAEAAIVHLMNIQARNELGQFGMFRVAELHSAILQLYADAQSNNDELAFLETELAYHSSGNGLLASMYS